MPRAHIFGWAHTLFGMPEDPDVEGLMGAWRERPWLTPEWVPRTSAASTSAS